MNIHATANSTARHFEVHPEVRRIGELTVVVDCYNANPQSVRASLDVLEGQASTAQKVAVLGTMLELGEASTGLHRELLADALAREIDLIVATGEFAVAAHALEATGSSRMITAATWREAYPTLRDRLEGDEVVLLKASRGVALEGILQMLADDFSTLGTGSVEA